MTDQEINIAVAVHVAGPGSFITNLGYLLCAECVQVLGDKMRAEQYPLAPATSTHYAKESCDFCQTSQSAINRPNTFDL